MPIVTLTKFAKLYDVSREAISKNIESGLIEARAIGTGKSKRFEIDTDSRKNKAYILTIDRDRQHSNRLTHKRKTSEQSAIIPSNPAVKPADDDLHGRYSVARVRKLEAQAVEGELKNAVRRGELLEKESVYHALFLSMDKLISNAERFAESFLPDIISEILEKGELTNEIRAKWKDGYFNMVDNWKNSTADKLKEMEKEQR